MIAAALAAAAVFTVLVLRPPSPTPALKLTARIESGTGEARRGVSAQEGDHLQLNGTIDGRRFAEVRVYRDDHALVLRCSEQDPCRRVAKNRVEVLFTIQARGRYQPVLLSGDHVLPDATGDLDRDMDAAWRAGAHIALGPDIDVH